MTDEEIGFIASSEGCENEGCTQRELEVFYEPLGPAFCRPAKVAAGTTSLDEAISDVDALIEEHLGCSFSDLTEERFLVKSGRMIEIDESSSAGESTSSVAFDCSPSTGESAGADLLGKERFDMLNRLLAARTPVETIALALNVQPHEVTEIVQTLKKKDGILARKKKVRCVKRLSDNKTTTYSQEAPLSGEARKKSPKIEVFSKIGKMFSAFVMYILLTFTVLSPTSEIPEINTDVSEVSGIARPVSSRARPAKRPDSDVFYGFSDTGTELVVRPPEEGDVVVGEVLLEGLDSNPVVGSETDDGETSCSSETLIMLPEGSLQRHLGFEVAGKGDTRTFTKGNVSFVSRWKDGHFWFNRDDTNEIRFLLSQYWRARKGRSAPKRGTSVETFGKLRLDYDKSRPWVHALAEKMRRFGIEKDVMLRLWDRSRTVQYFAYSCRQELQKLRSQQEEKLVGGPPSRVSFSSRPVKHGFVDVPLSHHFTHRPKLAGCPVCEQSKATLTPIVRTSDAEGGGDGGVEGGRLRIDADYPGRPFPLGSDGSRVCLMGQSEDGHFFMIPMKNKTEEVLLDKGKSTFSKAGLELPKVDLYADAEIAPLGKHVEKEGGSYNSGIANRANSHARAENCVKNGLGALKACSMASATPPKDWPSLARTLMVNLSREIGNKFIGSYKGPLFIHGECSFLKLEENVYTPPVLSPTGTKCQFVEYQQNSSYGIIVEFYDEHLQKRRRTEVSSTAFTAGLPAKRPTYGYKRVESEKEPLSTYIQGLLSELEEPIELPKERELKEYEKANPKARAKAAAKSKAAAKARARIVNQSTEGDEIRAQVDWCESWDSATQFEAWDSEFDYSSQEVYLDLGQTDMQDFDEGRTPMEVSVGEQARVSSVVRPGRDFVKLVKVLRPKEIAQEPYNKLDWAAAYKKEKSKMFETFGSLGKECVEMSSLPEGAQLLFNFGVHTVKNYDHHPSWEAGYRLVGAGNQIYVLRGGRWVKQPSVIDRQRDALESATLESTRLFIHTQKIRKRKVRKDDADGAYLQAPQNTENRPVGLWAELPQCMWPDDSPAWQLRRPVFPVLTSLYGTDDASFSWDRYSRHQLESQGFWPYYDLSQSLYDFFAPDQDLSVLQTEGEIQPEDYPRDIGILSQYVDDFLSAEDQTSDGTLPVNSKMREAIKFKGIHDENSDDLGRYVGSTWDNVNGPPDENGVYNYSQHQIEYVATFVESADKQLAELGEKPIKHCDTPALANDSKDCDELDRTPGVLKDICASIVCALLYVARSSRIDILFAVCRLTRYLTDWHVRQDLWLYRVLGYLKRTVKYRLNFKICPKDFEPGGDGRFENLGDADLGGDPPTKRSTSGGVGFLLGARTRALVHAHCKRQGQAGLSTPEAETVSLVVLGKKTIPLHMIAQRLLKGELKLLYRGDNSASERVVGTGISAALAYLKRTAQLSLTWAKSNVAPYLGRVPSGENTSDIFTKPLDSDKFHKFRIELGVYE